MDHFEHGNGLAIILRLIIYKMELGELSPVFLFFFFFTIPTSLFRTKEKLNKRKGEITKNI